MTTIFNLDLLNHISFRDRSTLALKCEVFVVVTKFGPVEVCEEFVTVARFVALMQVEVSVLP